MADKKLQKQTKQVETFFETRAKFVPATANEETRTVEVVFATETPVLRNTPYSLWETIDSRTYNEVLVCTAAAVNAERINSGAPVLNTHSRYDLDSVIGKVEENTFKIRDGKCVATLRLSTNPEVDRYWNDIKSGILTNVSVGYEINELTISEHKEGDTPTCRATKWTPAEISFVPVPADHNSGTRADDKKTHEISILKSDMETVATPEGSEVRTQAAPAPAAAPAQVATPVNQEEVRTATAQAIAAERSRVKIINSSVRTANLPETFGQKLIDDGATVEAARAAIFEEMEKNQVTINPNQTARVGAEATTKRREAVQAAMEYRVSPTPECRAKAGEFLGMPLLRLAEDSITAAGGNVRGASQMQIAQGALNLDTRGVGMHSTSDFPILLGNLFNTTLRAAYAVVPKSFEPFVRRVTARNFREQTMAQIGDIGAFEEVKEGGEYKGTTLSEAAEKWRLAKYGRILTFTWEMMLADDLGAFSDVSRNFSIGATQTQLDKVYAILTGNPTMADGNKLFSAAHNNYKGTANASTGGTDITIEDVGKAIATFRTQKTIGNNYISGLAPKFMIVGPSMELKALQFVSPNFVAQTSTNINIYKGLFTVIVDPRITDNAWYLAADPNAIDTIIVGYLEGENDIYTEQKTAFDQDGEMMKARLVFGTKAIDYRGLYKNNGPAVSA